MKVVPIRLAVMEQQLGVTISEDGTRLIGYLFANLLNDITNAGHVNVTYSSIRDNIGSCDENSYLGAYQLLYDNESDASLFMPSNANCARLSPFEPGKVFIDSSSNILMMRRLERSHMHFSSLMGTTPLLMGLIIVAFSLIILTGIVLSRNIRIQIMRIRNKQYTKKRPKRQIFRMFWLLVAVALRQSAAIRSTSWIARLLFYLHCWLMIMFLVFFSSSFKTDLMMKKHVETIDTLQALAQSQEYRATFPLEWNLWRRFRDSQDAILQMIWRKATSESGKSATIPITTSRGSIDPFQMIREMREGRVFISDKNINRFLVNAYCVGYDEDNKDRMEDIVYLSRQTFFPTLILGIMRVLSPPEVKQRFNFVLQCFNENGYHDFYVRNPLGILRKTVEQKKCFRQMRLLTMGDGSEQDIHPIIWTNITDLVYDCAAILTLSCIVLLAERVRIYMITVHAKLQVKPHITTTIRSM